MASLQLQREPARYGTVRHSAAFNNGRHSMTQSTSGRLPGSRKSAAPHHYQSGVPLHYADQHNIEPRRQVSSTPQHNSCNKALDDADRVSSCLPLVPGHGSTCRPTGVQLRPQNPHPPAPKPTDTMPLVSHTAPLPFVLGEDCASRSTNVQLCPQVRCTAAAAGGYAHEAVPVGQRVRSNNC